MKKDALSRQVWDKRTLVKSWTLRGTLHLMRADEYELWVGALANYTHYQRASWMKFFGVTANELERVLEAVGEALGDEPITREELAQAVEKKVRSKKLGETLRSGWGSLLKPASFRGKLCYGPSRGQNVTFIGPEAWLGRKLEPPDPEDALREVSRRFALLNGPVSREELARWWSGFSPAQAGRILSSLDDLVPVDVEGELRYVAAKDLKAAGTADARNEVHLVPAFDQYVVMSPRHPAVLDPRRKERVFRKAAWLSPVLLVGGRIEGVWWWDRKGARLTVTFEPFTKQPAWVKKKAEAEARRLGGFLNAEPQMSWSPVD